MAKKEPLPQRQGFFPTGRRQHPGSKPDGWEDDKRDLSKEPPPSTEHVAKHSVDGYPLGKRNP